MPIYQAVVDFRTMSRDDMKGVRAGFRAMYSTAFNTPDAHIDFIVRAFGRTKLLINGDHEMGISFGFAVGEAIASRAMKAELERRRKIRQSAFSKRLHNQSSPA